MIVKTPLQFDQALAKIDAAHTAVVDLETEGLNVWGTDKMCGVGICLPDETTYYFPFRHKSSSDLPILAMLIAAQTDSLNLPGAFISRLYASISRLSTLIGHNLKFDLAAMHGDGYVVPESQRLEDTITASRLYFPDKHDPLDLESVSEKILGTSDAEYKKKFQLYLKRNGWASHFDHGEPEIVGEYCEHDTLNTWRIRQFLVRSIDATGQRKIWDQECELMSVLFEMERVGLYFDPEYLGDRLPKLRAKIEQKLGEIYAEAGFEFDVNSTDQLSKAFAAKGVTSPAVTATGKQKWSLGELLSVNVPLSNLILEFRSLDKIRTTYFEPLLQWKDCVIHPNNKPWGTVTGRMAVSNPNLQNQALRSIDLGAANELEAEEIAEAMDAMKAMLGAKGGQYTDMTAHGGSRAGGMALSSYVGQMQKYKDDDNSVNVRRLYIPRPGFTLYMIDFEQMEMRVFADYVKDPQLVAMLEDAKVDFHGAVAHQVWGANPGDGLWSFYRSIAKSINFGLIYGIGNKKLASQIQKTEEEAVEYRRQYFERFPLSERFISQVQRVVENRGYVINRFGRRYHLPRERSYVGVNYLVQGTSADIVKNRMIAFHNWIRKEGLKSRLLIQVHDELMVEVANGEEQIVVPELKRCLEERLIDTLLPTDVSIGLPSWAHKKKFCVSCFEIKEKDHDCSLKKKRRVTPKKRKVDLT